MPLFPKIFQKIIKTGNTLTNGNTRYSASAQNIINKFKDQPINNIQLIRKELSSGINLLLEAVNLGEFKSKSKELGYDKLYHLSCIIDTDVGRISVEKMMLLL